MEKQQAINVLNQVYENFKGTLEEHKTVQQALVKVGTLVEPIVEKKVQHKSVTKIEANKKK